MLAMHRHDDNRRLYSIVPLTRVTADAVFRTRFGFHGTVDLAVVTIIDSLAHQ